MTFLQEDFQKIYFEHDPLKILHKITIFWCFLRVYSEKMRFLALPGSISRFLIEKQVQIPSKMDSPHQKTVGQKFSASFDQRKSFCPWRDRTRDLQIHGPTP